MLSHEEMIGLQAEKHELTDEDHIETTDQYVLHLMHCSAYLHAARVVEGKSVIDLGCNTGYGTNILHGHAEQVVGVDVSARAISQATDTYSDVDFRVIDGIRLPFDDDSFDVATCFQIIEHLVEYDSFMSELKRVLTPGGIAIFTTPNALLRLDPGMKPWNPFHVREFDAEELTQTLDSYFGHVGILALYGRDPVHQIVVERADRIRRSTRARASAESAKIRTKTPHAGHSPKYQPPSLQFVRDNHDVEDFYYRPGGLTNALEFMAICSAGDIATCVESLADGTS